MRRHVESSSLAPTGKTILAFLTMLASYPLALAGAMTFVALCAELFR